jgi:hypothetical protein
MALRDRHLAIAVAVACLTIAASFLPPADRNSAFRWGEYFSLERGRSTRGYAGKLEQLARVRAEHLLALQLADSVLRSVPAGAAGEGPLLLYDRRIPPPMRDAFQRALDAQARIVHGPSRRYRTVTAVLVDTITTLAGVSRVALRGASARYLLPELTDGRTCFTLVTITRVNQRLDGEEWRAMEPALLGPCAYYAAFGAPGARVDRWLHQRQFDLAMSAQWDRRAEPIGGGPSWYMGVPPGLAGRLYLLFFQPNYYAPIYQVSFAGFSCAGGDLNSCRALMMTPPDESFQMSSRGNLLVRPNRWYLQTRRRYGLLSDLVAERGRDKFAQFWTSPQPVDSAFATAYGLPIENWTHDWTRATYPGLNEGRDPLLVKSLVGLLLCAAAFGASTAFAIRRQVAY